MTRSMQTHMILSSIHTQYEWDWAAAERAARRAAELNPNVKFVPMVALAGALRGSHSSVEVPDRGQPKVVRAAPLPRVAYFVASRYDEAIAQAKEVLEAQPNYPFTHIVLGWSYAFKGMYAEAVASCDRGRELHPPGANIRGDSGCSYVYSLAGDR